MYWIIDFSWLREHTDGVKGVFYFADDDNTYTGYYFRFYFYAIDIVKPASVA